MDTRVIADRGAQIKRLRMRERVLLLAFSLVMLLPGTFGVSLTDRDEGWYAQVSREMLVGGDWLVPHYLGQPWLAKPPLLYWCVATSFGLFGQSAAAARLVPVLATVVAVQLIATLAAQMFDRRVALLAAMSYLTAGLPVLLGKLLLTDALLLLCCVGAQVLLWRIATGRPSVARCVGFWACVGLGILAKGPAVLVFVGAFGLGLLARPQWRGWLRSATFWLAVPAALVIASPWYAHVARHAGGTFVQQFIGYEIVARITSAPHGHTGPPGYYLLVGLAGWLPWTALVPGAVIEMWRGRGRERTAWLLLLWFGLPWVLLELLPSKLPHYILPCYVPLAIMFGRMWAIGLERVPTRGQRGVLGIWVAVAMALGAALVGAAIGWHALAWAPAGIVCGAVLLVGFGVVGWFVRGGRLQAAWTSAVGATALFHVLLGVWFLPGLEPYRLSRNIAEQANRLAQPDAVVLVSGYEEPTLFFYLRARARILRAEQLDDALSELDREAVLVIAEPTAAGLGAVLGDPNWQRVRGFNYVKGRDETVWVGRLRPLPATREADN